MCSWWCVINRQKEDIYKKKEKTEQHPKSKSSKHGSNHTSLSPIKRVSIQTSQPDFLGTAC